MPSSRKRYEEHCLNRQQQKTGLGAVNQNSRVSMRNIAHKIRVSDILVRRIVKEDLHLMPYKLSKVQRFTDDNKREGLKRRHRLLRRHAPFDQDRILFTDNKLFTIEQAHNHQNDLQRNLCQWRDSIPFNSLSDKK